MKRTRRRKCNCCDELFTSDARNRGRQKFCSKEVCRKASKAESQRRWLNYPENRDYFKGPLNVARVREWRARNPGYWKRKGKVEGEALQDVLPRQNASQPIETTQQRGDLALQEFLTPQNGTQRLILIGLIAMITGTTLQDDIASASRNLLRLGADIMCGNIENPVSGGVANSDEQASDLCRAGAPCAEAI